MGLAHWAAIHCSRAPHNENNRTRPSKELMQSKHKGNKRRGSCGRTGGGMHQVAQHSSSVSQLPATLQTIKLFNTTHIKSTRKEREGQGEQKTAVSPDRHFQSCKILSLRRTKLLINLSPCRRHEGDVLVCTMQGCKRKKKGSWFQAGFSFGCPTSS